MQEVIATGKSVEEATEAGCRELGKTRDEVSVEILEMPIRKLFKNIPAKVKVTVLEAEAPVPAKPKAPDKPQKPQAEKPARKPVENKPEKAAPAPQPGQKAATVLETEPEEQIDIDANLPVKAAAAYLTEIFAAMGAGIVNITASRQGDATLIRVEGEEIRNVVDIRGETIQALSYLADRAVNKGVDKRDPAYIRIRLDVSGYRSRRESELIALATRTGKEVASTKRSRTLAPMNPYERLIVHTTISGMEGLISESIGTDTERRVVIKSTAPDATDGDDWRPPRSGGAPRRDNNRRSGGGSGGSGNRSGAPRRDNNRRSGGGGPRKDQPRTNTPEREYADRPHDPNAKPVVPERREAIRDGDDLPLYGKIDI